MTAVVWIFCSSGSRETCRVVCPLVVKSEIQHRRINTPVRAPQPRQWCEVCPHASAALTCKRPLYNYIEVKPIKVVGCRKGGWFVFHILIASVFPRLLLHFIWVFCWAIPWALYECCGSFASGPRISHLASMPHAMDTEHRIASHWALQR